MGLQPQQQQPNSFLPTNPFLDPGYNPYQAAPMNPYQPQPVPMAPMQQMAQNPYAPTTGGMAPGSEAFAFAKGGMVNRKKRRYI
jgi:hypothetical protein